MKQLSNLSIGNDGKLIFQQNDPLEVLYFLKLSNESVKAIKSLAKNFNNDAFEALSQSETQYFLALKRFEEKYGTLDYAPKFSVKFLEKISKRLLMGVLLKDSQDSLVSWLENPRCGKFLFEGLDGKFSKKGIELDRNNSVSDLEEKIIKYLDSKNQEIGRLVFIEK